MLHVRKAEKSDIEWINKCYDEVDFMHLTFILCTNQEKVPKEILEKSLWCKEKYPQQTVLLILEK